MVLLHLHEHEAHHSVINIKCMSYNQWQHCNIYDKGFIRTRTSEKPWSTSVVCSRARTVDAEELMHWQKQSDGYCTMNMMPTAF